MSRISVEELYKYATFDANKYLVTLSREHRAVHDAVSYMVDDVASLSAGGVRRVILKTPANYILHTSFAVSSNLSGTASMWEGITFTGATGTELTAYNMYRPSNRATSASFYTPGGTITGLGTRIVHHVIGGGTAAFRFGGSVRGNQELDLKSNTWYMLQFTADANSTKVDFTLEYYEVTL